MKKKKVKEEVIQHRVGVYCTESDLKDDTVAFLAIQCGLIREEDYTVVEKEVDNKIIKEFVVSRYTEEAIQAILKNLFGFRDGWYEVEVIDKQKSRLTNKLVTNEKRYTGLEREDKEWVNSRMCSDEMKTAVMFGSYGEI